MEIGVDQMYFDLTSLLEDICSFLSTDKLGSLSPKDQKLAESLLNRSKKQLQNIAKIKTQPSEDYVIMNNPSDLPAKEACQNVKCGIISMKRRMMLGFETFRKVYACVHKGWLLIYASEKELKPLHTFDLKNYEARDFGEDKSNFELIRSKTDKKVYQFVALTPKDMLQWTAKINKFHDTIFMMLARKASSIALERKCSIEQLRPSSSSTDDEDRIYEVLKTVPKVPRNVTPKPVVGKPLEKPPPPPRISSRKPSRSPINVPPPVVKKLSVTSVSSSSSTYDEIIQKPKETSKENSNDLLKSNSNSTKSLDSFSEGSADSTYETFSNMDKFLPDRKGICTAESDKDDLTHL